MKNKKSFSKYKYFFNARNNAIEYYGSMILEAKRLAKQE